MDIASQLKRGISRQFSTGSLRMSRKFSFQRQNSLDPRRNNYRFSFGRQSSMDPIRRNSMPEDGDDEGLTVPDNLDSTMQLLFMACKGDVAGLEDLLDDGIDVNSIDLDGRTALHIAACEGHVEVAKLLLRRKANIDARDRWGSTVECYLHFFQYLWFVFSVHLLCFCVLFSSCECWGHFGLFAAFLCIFGFFQEFNDCIKKENSIIASKERDSIITFLLHFPVIQSGI